MEDAMPPSLDQAQVALAAQPFSRLLGVQLNTFGPDGVELEVPVRPAHRQQHGFAHGGVLGYAADNALTFAAGAVAGPGVLTAAYTINVLAPSSATACSPRPGSSAPASGSSSPAAS